MTPGSLHARPRARLRLVAILLATTAAGCARQPDSAPAAPPVEVKAVTVEPSATETYADKVGEVRGSQEVDLRARVSGILLATAFRGRLAGQARPAAVLDRRARVPRPGGECPGATRLRRGQPLPRPAGRGALPAAARRGSDRAPGLRQRRCDAAPGGGRGLGQSRGARRDEARPRLRRGARPADRTHRRGPGLSRQPGHGRADGAGHALVRRPGLGLLHDQRG